ncbi:MAG TPA: SEC-C metal-binding domain-containing protein [Candidatus Eremiobacteraceae bacterium]|nr:SEC-C metal-binding domain-containing protein [Candidatus Eremiobacteraceae bacterium]
MTAKKIGRNEPCPCNSGKKYKLCCGNTGAPSAQSQRDAATKPDLGPRVLIVPASNEMLMNRVHREATNVAQGFDDLARVHVQLIDRLYSSAAGIVMMGKQHAEFDHDDVRMTFAILSSNVLKSFTAAFSLLRAGWRLQPFMCLRNAYEGLGVAIHLAQRPEDLVPYKNGDLDSTRTISSAKNLLPFFGRVWGDFSQQFTHIGEPFRHIQLGNMYAKDEKDLWHALFHLAFFIWFAFEVAELVFYDSVPVHHFWERGTDEKYTLRLSKEMQHERRQLIEQYRQFLAPEPVAERE